MFAFIGDHFLYVVLGSFALFGAALGWASLRYALTPQPSELRRTREHG